MPPAMCAVRATPAFRRMTAGPSAGMERSSWRRPLPGCGALSRSPEAVTAVNDQAHEEPRDEARPRRGRQVGDEQETRGQTEQRHEQRAEGHPERSMAIGLAKAQDDDPDADEHEGEESADVRQVDHLVDARDGAHDADE